MSTFYEKEGFSIFGEMLRQGFEPCAIQAQKILIGEEKAAQGDVGVAIASSSVSLACSAAILALSGFTSPLFVSVGVVGISVWQAWNSRVSQAEREKELLFLREYGSNIEKIIQQRIQSGIPFADLANVYEVCLDAFECSRNPLKALLGASPMPRNIETDTKVNADEVTMSDTKLNAVEPPSTNWINNLISQTALIWGNQGSGKSWVARYVAKLKKDKGYRVIVLDPDSNRAEWRGVESYHDFEEIADFLRWYIEELKARYKAFNESEMTESAWKQKLWDEGRAIAVVCEEVTTYIDLLDDKDLLTQFFRLGLTKSRKQEMPLTFVSHNNTQSALGGIKGLSNLIEKMLQLELKTTVNPESLQPTASGEGAVKLDGSSQWMPVLLPKLTQKITDFGGQSQPTVVQRTVTTPKEFTQNQQLNTQHQATTELKIPDSLAEPLKAIWLWTKERNDWVSVRDVQRKDFAVLKGKSSEQIHQFLGLLADSGYGEIDEEGKSHSSVRFRTY